MDHEHHGHDHAPHEHVTSSPVIQPSVGTVVAQTIRTTVENATQAIINATTIKPAVKDDNHAHDNHHNHHDHDKHQSSF